MTTHLAAFSKALLARVRSLELRPAAMPLVFSLVIVACCSVPFFISLPTPRDAVVLRSAVLEDGGAPAAEITLPYTRVQLKESMRADATYRMHFSAGDVPADHPVLFFPAVRQAIDVRLNDTPLERRTSSLLTSPRYGDYYAFDIDRAALRDGDNELEIVQSRVDGWVSSYLSPVYLTSYSAFLPYQQLYGFALEQWRFTSLMLKAIITLSVVVIALLRRSDRFFGWFGLIMVSSLTLTATQYGLTIAGATVPRLYYAILQLATLLMAVALALEMAGRKFAQYSLYFALGLPLALLVPYWLGFLPESKVTVAGNMLSLGAMIVALWIASLHYFRSRDAVAAIIAFPLGICLLFGIHDVGLMFGAIDGAHMLTPYVEMATLLAAVVIITIRLVQSLNQLDGANIELKQRLAEQQSELSLLYEKERKHAAYMILEQERDRLMRDLHDGLSGHLVSIMAQSERETLDRVAIGTTARDALSDLRLVIQSLDLNDRDLRVALASFRERTGPQLRRMGVVLDWSTETMPEVSGVTPSNALSLLRILQEAVTNAVKHGPARRISICASANDTGEAIITVENDVSSAESRGTGYGLINMAKRARSFGGDVTFTLARDGARLIVTLPAVLR